MSCATRGVIALLNLPGSRILIGPWTHCQNPGFELLQEIHRFFDTYLKDSGHRACASEPRVHYYTMDGDAGGTWKLACRRRLAGAPRMHRERWFVGQPAAQPSKRPDAAAAVPRTHSPCMSPSTVRKGGVGPFMQPCHTAGEGLSLRSAALAADLTLTGNPVVNLPVSADRADVNVFAYLEDVAPDGRIAVITEGRLKASLAAESPPPLQCRTRPGTASYAEDAHPLQPGQ